MNEDYGWNHPIDESDQWDGFNEPGIEHFAGSPIPHLAREVNQNSLDSGRGVAVKVVIKHQMVETAQLPNLEELKATIALCGGASAEESAKARQFFESAETELRKSKLSILEISDFNTKGMAGPSKNGTSFYAFMKAKGQSKKTSETATGSFGIGKFAPYAVSRLRTVFVSTVYLDQDSKFQRLTQGKSILMSHDDDDRRRQGVGFWGVKERCQPVVGSSDEIPSWILRGGEELTEEDLGTKLVILGFDNSSGWQDNLATSVAENFFGSIAEGNLEVDIDDKYLLTKNNVKNFFLNESLSESIKSQKNEPEQFRNAKSYLACLTEQEGVITELGQMSSLGHCQLKIVIAPGLPKRVCVLRNGMFISDSLNLPGLKNFSDFKEFVAVFECKSSIGIELLRAMEPPRHDDFAAERLPSKEDQLRGKKALKEMATWIREMLKRHAKDPVSDVTTLDELKDFFPDDSGEGNGKPAEEINPFGSVVIRVRKVTPNLNKPSPFIPEPPPPPPPPPPPWPPTPYPPSPIIPQPGPGASRPGIALNNLRAVSTSGKSRRILFTPLQSGLIAVSLYEAGADSDYDIAIKECDRGEIKNGRVILEVEAGVRTALEIVLKSSFEGALKVVAHEI